MRKARSYWSRQNAHPRLRKFAMCVVSSLTDARASLPWLRSAPDRESTLASTLWGRSIAASSIGPRQARRWRRSAYVTVLTLFSIRLFELRVEQRSEIAQWLVVNIAVPASIAAAIEELVSRCTRHLGNEGVRDRSFHRVFHGAQLRGCELSLRESAEVEVGGFPVATLEDHEVARRVTHVVELHDTVQRRDPLSVRSDSALRASRDSDRDRSCCDARNLEPLGTHLRSPTSSATSSERRKPPAKPSSTSARSRTPSKPYDVHHAAQIECGGRMSGQPLGPGKRCQVWMPPLASAACQDASVSTRRPATIGRRAGAV
jgi:hypothetical protein